MRYVVWLFLLCCISDTAQAYELYTHSSITQAIWQNANSVVPDLFALTGLYADDEIGGVSPQWTHRFYYDFTQDTIHERHAASFSYTYLKNALKPQGGPTKYFYTAEGWMIRGSVREDDIPFGESQIFRMLFQDGDPNGVIIRVLNHFYDPIIKRPLTIPVIPGGPAEPLGKEAPNWALGTTNFKQVPLVADATRGNHFSLFDAREAMFRAVTGQTTSGSSAIVPDGSGGYRVPVDAAEAEQARKAYWATAFRSLGDMLHLIEDMGQPQHTRNDAHDSDHGVDARVYERYTDDRANGDEFRCNSGDDPFTPLSLVLTPYKGATIQFNSYGDYRHSMS